jgi:hypothetical protein
MENVLSIKTTILLEIQNSATGEIRRAKAGGCLHR